jgi:hypothetical protein
MPGKQLTDRKMLLAGMPFERTENASEACVAAETSIGNEEAANSRVKNVKNY